MAGNGQWGVCVCVCVCVFGGGGVTFFCLFKVTRSGHPESQALSIPRVEVGGGGGEC